MAILTVHHRDLTPAQLSTALLTHGLGRLPYATRAETTRKINGDWCLKLAYPMEQPGAELLRPDNLIQAGGQLWRIHRISPRDTAKGRVVEVEAPHIAYDLKDYNIVNIETKEDSATPDGINARQALTQILAGTPFSAGTVDVDLSVLDYLDILQISPFAAIKEQVLKLWGGELVFDNFTIHLRAAMGTDRRYPIRARRNIREITFMEDIEPVVTRLHVRGYQNANFESINDGKDYIDSQYLNDYSHVKEGYVDYDDVDDPQELLTLGQAELARRELPKITYKVSLARLAGSLQYQHYARLERFDLGDTAALHHDYLDTDILVRAVELTRDELREVNTSVTLGNPQEDIITAITAGKTASDTIAHLVSPEGYLRAEKLAGPIDLVRVTNLVAEILRAVSGEFDSITAQNVDTNALYAGLVQAMQADLGRITADTADISALYSALVNAVHIAAKSADIDFLKVIDLTAGSAVFRMGTGGELYIDRLTVNEGNLVSLSAGKLMVKGVDGKWYTLQVGSDGITPIRVEEHVTDDNIGDGTLSGGKIVEGSINVDRLNAATIQGNQAFLVELTAGLGNFGTLFANEAIAEQLKTHLIHSDYLKVAIQSGENVAAYFEFLASGLRISAPGSQFYIQISNEEIGFFQSGVKVAWITGSMLHMPRAKIESELQIGQFTWVKESNGSLSLQYV